LLKAYCKCFLYIINHKLNVLIECWKEGLYIQGIFHDMSKFSPKEQFHPYTKKFFSGNKLTEDEELEWKYAWLHHQHKNKHHWEYWIVNPQTREVVPMPTKYLVEMVCDWRPFSRKWGKRFKESDLDLTDKIILHHDTKVELELFNKKDSLVR
jgi:hypothetical protein